VETIIMPFSQLQLTNHVLTSSGIQFDGSNDGFTLTNDISEANLNLFLVLQGYGYVFANNGTDRALFLDSNQNLYWIFNSSTTFDNIAISAYSSSSSQLLEFSLNSGTAKLRLNGSEASSQGSVSGNFKIDRIGLTWDETTGQPTWTGKIMEILAVTRTTDRWEIEGYLAHKWGLSNTLASSHPWKTANPVPSGSPIFIADTPFGDGKAIDLIDGHVEISTGGNEDVFDGNGSFSVSAWVKGWPKSASSSIVSKASLPVLTPGWKASHLTGDLDSGISSDHTYTHAINVNGSNKTINGVTFTGASGTSGNGWSYPAGFTSTHNSNTSTVGGQMGSMLSNGFRYNGNSQKIRLTGLTHGKAYVFSLYSQAWGSAGRECVLTCSDSSQTITVQQDQYGSSSQDGLLVECTYIASGTEVEFTISKTGDGSWHLYAFSNREPGLSEGWSVGRGDISNNDLSVVIGGIGGSKTATHSTALSTDNQWHHIVSTYDGGTRKIYLDGTEVSSASASGGVASTAASLLLGASDLNNTAGTIAAARHSRIKLDEVRFYTSGLTPSQVSALYNFGKGDIGNIGEFSTLPAKISGTKGTALSSTVTAGFPNAYYEAVNLTPGLDINSATGEISGTPTVGGVGSITVIAKNAAGKRAVTTIPYDSNPTGPAFSFPPPLAWF
jgi:hypothetical protein